MTDSDNQPITEYRGRPVTKISIAIRNAGDGLSEGMAIEPEILEQGDEVAVLLRCTVAPHNYKPITDKGEDTGDLELEQVLKAGTATIVADEFARELLDKQALRVAAHRDAIERAKKAEKGVLTLDDELTAQHQAGDHADGLMAGCAECDAEVQAEKEEARDKVNA